MLYCIYNKYTILLPHQKVLYISLLMVDIYSLVNVNLPPPCSKIIEFWVGLNSKTTPA